MNVYRKYCCRWLENYGKTLIFQCRDFYATIKSMLKILSEKKTARQTVEAKTKIKYNLKPGAIPYQINILADCFVFFERQKFLVFFCVTSAFNIQMYRIYCFDVSLFYFNTDF